MKGAAMCNRNNAAILLLAMLIPLAQGFAQQGRIGRGKYLTEDVAKCQECHTARLASGELDRAAWLKGGKGPDITPGGALWKDRGEKGMLRFLETGDRHGRAAAKPMPPYKLRHDDAEAIVAYLKSLH
jgi:mono/diheme cytochrome c family protein